jgi:hypothetical protein
MMIYTTNTILVDSIVERDGFREVNLNWKGKEYVRRINRNKYGFEYIVVEGNPFKVEIAS